MDDSTFFCAIDGDALLLEAIDNADGEHVIVNIGYADGSNGLGFALTGDDAARLGHLLLTLAASL